MKKIYNRFEMWRSKMQFRISTWLVKSEYRDPTDIY